MDVKAIDSRTQFSGYVHKSVGKFVNEKVTQRSVEIVENALRNGKMPEFKEVDEVKSLGARILTRLQQFMGDTHKDTSISIRQRFIKDAHHPEEEFKAVYNLVITNPIAKNHEILLASSDKYRQSMIPNLHCNLNITALKSFENEIIPALEKRGQASIDSEIADAFIKKMTEVVYQKPLFWKSKLKRMYKKMNDYFKDLSGVVDEELGKKFKNVSDVVTLLTEK